MAIPDLIVDRIATPGLMAAKLLLPWGSATDGVGQRGAHQLLAATLSRGCGDNFSQVLDRNDSVYTPNKHD